MNVTEPTNLGEHIDNYFIGISTMGIMLLIYQIITYSIYIYNWWSASDHNIKVRLLPLQIYMRDIEAIIDNLNKTKNENRTLHLRKIRTEYNELIEADKYCWIQYVNPAYKHQKFYRKCWCCGKVQTPRFLYEMCVYKEVYTTKYSKFPILKPTTSKWSKLKERAAHFESKKIAIQRNMYTSSSGFYAFAYIFTCGYMCGSPRYVKAAPLEVDSKDVFFGRYQPYIVNTQMKTVDLDQNLFIETGERIKTKHRKMDGFHDSLARFCCGWWMGWTLQDMELAIKAEFDEEHLKSDLNIKF